MFSYGWRGNSTKRNIYFGHIFIIKFFFSSSLSELSFPQRLVQVMQGFDFSQMQAGVARFPRG